MNSINYLSKVRLLEEMGANPLIASGGRKNVPFQQYINAGYFTVKEVVLDDEDGYQIRLTPQLTGKGQQWLTRKLLEAGLLKPVAAE
ncbi:phage antirepressor KilAC domain-containing protein [Escherichia albertii]|uniref:phage antirepressor KilAC domain-containing protein n=1 Tax=Escherichia albertii TaxID=208962 RepID=UPI00093143D5|nr:phage antirepressor KilAC domain-containing protein [Escherichia albertii]